MKKLFVSLVALLAMGLVLSAAVSAIRFSVGRMTTLQEIDRSVELLAAAHGRL